MRPFAFVFALLLSASSVGAQSMGANPLDQAQAHWFAGRHAQALEVLTQAVAADPQQSRWRFTLAWMLQERGNAADAEAHLSRLIEDFPDYAEAHNNLAVIQAGRGDLDAAHQSLGRAVQLSPTHAQAQENLGDVLVRLASRAYSKAQGLQPQSRLQLKISQLDAVTRER
jgi:Flp pilus assembly protein TadD